MARKTRPIATVCNYGLCTKKATTIANNGIAYCRDHARLTAPYTINTLEIARYISDMVNLNNVIGADRTMSDKTIAHVEIGANAGAPKNKETSHVATFSIFTDDGNQYQITINKR